LSEKYHKLISKIEKTESKIGIVGLGQVGLPTALSFSDVGFDVTGYDISSELLASLENGKAPFEENGLQDLLNSCIHKKLFHTQTNFVSLLENSDIIIVCVPTPLTENVRPDLSALEKVCGSFLDIFLNEKLIIIESSIPPGTFANLVVPILQSKNKIGENCWAAFVPERLAPGQALHEIRTTPRVIGHYDEDSGKLAKALYQKLVTSEIIVTSATIAEISKLVENTYRYVNVALANEVGLICEKYGIDFKELQKVCNSHPRVNLHQSGPGVGGPCLPKDPYLLLNPQGKEPIDSKIISYAHQINDSMPAHIVSLVEKGLKHHGKSISNSKIGVLGVAYKANVSETRLSPAKEIISLLIKNSAQIQVYDPKTKETFGGNPSDLWNCISNSDAIVIVTDHNEFKSLDLGEIKNKMNLPVVIDTRRIFDNKKAESLGITYLAVGYSSNHNK